MFLSESHTQKNHYYSGNHDVITDDWLIECKTTTATSKASFSIKKEWLEKNKEEAFAMNKSYNALAFSFGENELNYYVIDEKTFKRFMEEV